MGINSTIGTLASAFIAGKIKRQSRNAIRHQDAIMKSLISNGKNTIYGKQLGFEEIRSYYDFQQKVPLTDYEKLTPFIDRIADGEKDLLWPGQPIYFATTSGTTSGSKYIPITSDSIHNHIDSARDALLNYMHHSGNYAFADGKMIFLQGSPVLSKRGKIPSGRLSGIVAHHVPGYLQKNRLLSWKTNCIEDWEEKVNAIVDETIVRQMTLISGIPPWLRMYFEKVIHKTGKKIGEVWPELSLLVYGGVNFTPYQAVFNDLIGRDIDTLEFYPASEGFIAYQHLPGKKGLLLNTNSGIFFEFIPVGDGSADRIPLKDVTIGKDYEIVLSSNAGLWAYRLGDTVQFTCKQPYCLVVTGRVAHFISAFGEHVIATEVEKAMTEVAGSTGVSIKEFTVAPAVNPGQGLPHHEWIIEFKKQPESLPDFANNLDQALRNKNKYYDELVTGKILSPLRITPVKKDTFRKYQEENQLLGGQHKVVRLANNRDVADELLKFNT